MLPERARRQPRRRGPRRAHLPGTEASGPLAQVNRRCVDRRARFRGRCRAAANHRAARRSAGDGREDARERWDQLGSVATRFGAVGSRAAARAGHRATRLALTRPRGRRRLQADRARCPALALAPAASRHAASPTRATCPRHLIAAVARQTMTRALGRCLRLTPYEPPQLALAVGELLPSGTACHPVNRGFRPRAELRGAIGSVMLEGWRASWEIVWWALWRSAS
jgi:hypothetical protein